MRPIRLCPYLIVKDCSAAIEFYVRVLGAVEEYRLTDPIDGRIGHAELLFGETRVFLADEYPDFGALSPDTIGGSPVKMHLDVEDADAFVAEAVKHGASLLRPVRKEFHGSRVGLIADPFGYSWFISAKAEEVSAEEAQKRWSESISR